MSQEQIENKHNEFLKMCFYDDEINYIKRMIDEGIDINYKNNKGQFALLNSLGVDRKPDIMNLLLHHKVDMNAINLNGNTALMEACDINPSFAKILIDRGANVHIKNKNNETSLIFAAKSKVLVKKLLLRKVDVNVISHEGETALTRSLHHNGVVSSTSSNLIAKMLLAAGADVNPKSNNAISPLMFAIRFRNPIVFDFIKMGADIHHVDKNNDSPLTYALMYNPEIIPVLLNLGAKPDRDRINKLISQTPGVKHSSMALDIFDAFEEQKELHENHKNPKRKPMGVL